MTQAFLVCRLEKTGTKAPMDLDTRPDHSPTDFISLAYPVMLTKR